MELVIFDRIRNRKVEFFNSFKVNLVFNSVASQFELDFYFDPDIFELKEMACIGHYHICKLYHNGELILTGTILSQKFHNSTTKQLVPISGYSLPGVLEDCQIPTDSAIDEALNKNLKWPASEPIPYCALQDDVLTLRSIATKLVRPFTFIGGLNSPTKLTIKVDSSVSSLMDDPFDKTNAKPKDTIKNYLTELATQKNINITHDAEGNLLFTKVRTDLVPILDFDVPTNGGIIGTTFDLQFNGQSMHSQITAMKQNDGDSKNEAEKTVTNPYVPYSFRPKTVLQTSGTDIDTLLCAKNALAEELRNLKLTITLDRWLANNKIIRPNNTVTVRNPQIYIFKKTKWFIEAVELKGDQKSQISTLHCVLPSVYDGSDPDYIFAGINQH